MLKQHFGIGPKCSTCGSKCPQFLSIEREELSVVCAADSSNNSLSGPEGRSHTAFLPLNVHLAKINAVLISVIWQKIHVIIVSTQHLPITGPCEFIRQDKGINASLIKIGLEADG